MKNKERFEDRSEQFLDNALGMVERAQKLNALKDENFQLEKMISELALTNRELNSICSNI